MTFLLLSVFASTLSCASIKGADELMAGTKYLRKSHYEHAIEKLSEGIEKNPEHWKFYFYRGEAYQKTDKIDLAINDLSKSLKLIPEIKVWYSKLPVGAWALIYVRRGTLYQKQSFYDLAIDDFNQALELDPQCDAAFFYRAATKEKMNRLSAAIEDYSKVVDMMSKFFSGISDSDKSRVYFERGAIYARMEKFEKAISDFDNSIKINPAIAENAYLYRASVELITSCDLEKVLEDYYSVVDIETIDDDTRQLAYNQIAWILATAADASIRDGEKALIYARKSVKIQANCRNFDTLAVAFAESGKFENAIDTHKKAVAVCKLKNPELLTAVEKHFENYEAQKALREECPGAEIEWEQLRKWRKGL